MSGSMPPTPAMAETEYGKFAQERSHSDAKGLVEYGKAVIQMMIGINGLAATGLITLAAASKQTAVTQAGHFAPAIMSYLIGVFFGILSSIFIYGAAQYWTMRWEQSAYPNMALAMTYRTRGINFHRAAIGASIAGLVAFLVGGILALWALKHP
jgi:hypothetical protein